MKSWKSIEGAPFPLGVSWVAEERSHNFALYSKHAETVTLLLYRDDDLVTPALQFQLDYLRNKSGPIWHCRVPATKTKGAKFYAFRIGGPPPSIGYGWHGFDSEKVLLDPYARSVFFPPAFDREAARNPGPNDGRAPLGILQTEECVFDWSGERRVRHGSDLVIYEMHVKGFTQRANSGVPVEKRGTFAGVIEKIPYLQELGITAVELMPVFQFDPQEENYWGYMPLNFFAPHHEYAVAPSTCEQHNQFRAMVKALHAAGIEVILDVVYNHTCEGNDNGPTYSYKGIDNSTYYMVSGDSNSPYSNFSGTGNTLHTANRAVRQLIVDSLRYWDRDMHVDGFRFDLASIFTRRSDGTISVEEPPIFGQIAADPELADMRLIAEPWDAGGAYHLGSRFPGVQWMQWNASYRDALQRFVRGDGGQVSELMARIYGSSDLFPDDRFHAYRPYQSVNYVTSHDGFTLYDLVTYNHKRNLANGHNNDDGHQDFSWNCGWEGKEDVPQEVEQRRKQQVKNFFCLLLLSNGTPMFRMGDEFLQTQGGNSNPYNQDNETSWLDWGLLERNRDVFRFLKNMVAFRKAHASIGRSRFWREDVTWYGVDGSPDLSYWSHALAYCLHGASQNNADIYVMINGYWQDLEFGIQEGPAGSWKRVIDTSLTTPDDFAEAGDETKVKSSSYRVQARSVLVLLRG